MKKNNSNAGSSTDIPPHSWSVKITHQGGSHGKNKRFGYCEGTA